MDLIVSAHHFHDLSLGGLQRSVFEVVLFMAGAWVPLRPPEQRAGRLF